MQNSDGGMKKLVLEKKLRDIAMGRFQNFLIVVSFRWINQMRRGR
jgi:hypothetical protein